MLSLDTVSPISYYYYYPSTFWLVWTAPEAYFDLFRIISALIILRFFISYLIYCDAAISKLAVFTYNRPLLLVF